MNSVTARIRFGPKEKFKNVQELIDHLWDIGAGCISHDDVFEHRDKAVEEVRRLSDMLDSLGGDE